MLVGHKNIIKTLENLFNSTLESYIKKYNIPQTRIELKDKISDICKCFIDGGLIFEFHVLCDETNNTPDLIDKNVCVVDTNIKLYDEDLIFHITSFIGFSNNFVTIESECRGDEERMINYERQEKLDYIFKNEKEIIEI